MQEKQSQHIQGLVFGEILKGAHVGKDILAGFANFFGGRVGVYEKEFIDARNNALKEMQTNAENLGANAIIGIKVDYESLGTNNGILMVVASGTAVIVE